ncbi:LytTR family DNA-binding domain-containing protein [Flavihumibacter sp. CACIAM 22H1]|uniref:LytR/AlgR family response regulator transcription factor n=1 Tax=Flavihumibacter sp. CACIAM 22H1 TaxID=1812911 RepID=UPI0007A8BD3A|nr:LytTR family DNA-binding domain-containing protein [Flavihumibacter sp. CACIAM 22H1]KYP16559.1 MAG: DNA-binding response regulator [Flavihumibacter sp. CACIAM 22H1]
MLKVLIIDDEPLACLLVQEYLAAFPQMQVVGICHDGFSGLKAIQQEEPDLIFLDIQMPRINGFEMLELLEKQPAVIFTTAFDEYAMKAFDQHAVDYLLKPYSLERFQKAVQKYLSQQHHLPNEALLTSASLSPQQQDRIVIKDNATIRIIPVNQVHYIEAADDYIKIFTADGSWLKNKTMAAMEQQLPVHQFVRIHRSYLVNVQEISQLFPMEKESYTAILKNKKQLPVSKSGYQKLKEKLGI